MLKKIFKSSGEGRRLTKRRPQDTSAQASLPPQYSEAHQDVPRDAPPSFTSRPPSIAPSVASHATQLPDYDTVVPPGSRGRGLRWQQNGEAQPLPTLPRVPSPEPLTQEEIEAFARSKKLVDRIPSKVWDSVGDVSDPVSAACLKLTCRTIHDAMSSRHFTDLNNERNKHLRVEFLYAAAPDMPVDTVEDTEDAVDGASADQNGVDLTRATTTGSLDHNVTIDSLAPVTTVDSLSRITTTNGVSGIAEAGSSSSAKATTGVYDNALPFHLFCLNCGVYHKRLKPGQETLAPSYITSPVFNCPKSKTLPTPRLALTPSRRLPFTLPQLLARAHRLRSPAHGVHTSALSKTWVDIAEGFDGDPTIDPDELGFTSHDATDGAPIGWRHRTQLRVHHGHVLLRVSSTHALPARLLSTSELNRLLITRSNYEPYFSTCQHWHTAGPVGPLLSLAKCAIEHAQAPYRTNKDKEGWLADKRGKMKKPVIPPAGNAAVSITSIGSRLTTQCAECRPLRRCEECGTEYLFQLKVVQDRVRRKSSAGSAASNKSPAPPPLPKFRPYLSVTRFSDLGPCVRPDEPQWRSVVGDDGERPNEVRVRVCPDMPRHLKCVRGAFESDDTTGGATSGAAIPLGRRVEWVREHVEEVERERERERMLAERRARPQLAASKS